MCKFLEYAAFEGYKSSNWANIGLAESTAALIPSQSIQPWDDILQQLYGIRVEYGK
jgi:hypothetical protein